MHNKYIIEIEESDTGYAATVPSRPTILVTAGTLRETQEDVGSVD